MMKRAAFALLFVTTLLSATLLAAGVTRISYGTSLPTNCVDGNIFIKTSATAGLYWCSTAGSPGTWTALGGGSGTVTHTGTLTANLPIIGNGSADITTGTRSGDTTSFATTSGSLTSGHCAQFDASGNIVDASTTCGSTSPILDRTLGTNTISNNNTEQTLYTYTIGANTLGSTGLIRVMLRGTYTQNTGSGKTLTVKVKLGATTMFADTTGSIGTNTNVQPFQLDFLLWNNSSTSAQKLDGFFHVGAFSVGATTGSGGINNNFNGNSRFGGPVYGTASEDSTGALALTVTIQHSAASTSLSISRELAIVELL